MVRLMRQQALDGLCFDTLDELAQKFEIGGLGDKFCSSQCPRMTGIGFLALTRKHDDASARGAGEDVGD